ncbi:MAG: hypothetical protein K9N23_03130 [Akkermansiaceae bacterium]|nr:hypothetical protein [Akkermansiaceae bacterium]
MNAISAKLRQWLATLALGTALAAATATADVTLTATSPAGSTMIQPGGTFAVELTWSGTPAIAAADYAVTLNTSQLVFTGRDFDATLASYADTPYLAVLPTATNRIDATWFKAGGFTGKDLTLYFEVPANYTGPATLTIGLEVAGVQDSAAAAIPVTTAGTTVNLPPIGPVTGTNTTTAAQTANWSALTWTGATPNGNGDIANFRFNDTQTITLDVPVTLGRLSGIGTGHYCLLRSGINTLTFDNTNMGDVASLLFSRPPSLDALGRRFDSNLILNSDLVGTWARVQGGTTRIHGLRGLLSGTGRLSMNYAIAPTEGPDAGTSINLDGTSATAAHIIHLGLAGDAANTYTGGTDLRAGNSVFGTVKFITNKVNALGSPGTAARLFMHQAALDLSTFNQTVGGLTGGTGSSKISSTSSTAGITTLTIDFGSDKGPFDFSGVIMDGPATGVSGSVRTVGLAKSGSGIQTLTTAQTYTGPTAVTDGTLLVNGSLAAGSSVTVSSNGTLGGTGTVNGPTTNQGTIAPGASVGTSNLEAVTMEQNSRLTIEFADWEGTTPGSGWDLLNCASLALAVTPDEQMVITLQPLGLTNFAETGKTFTIATSATAITGFDAGAITINASAMPGTGTWTVQLDGTGTQLQVVYTTGGTAPSAYDIWAVAKGLTAGNRAPELDPDHDNSNNLAEFAFNGDPLAGSNNGLFFTERRDTAADPDSDQELVFTCAVRRGAVFASNGSNAQVSAAIDGAIYTVEGSADLTTPWASAVSNVGAADTPPAGSGLPDLTGSGWEYRTFSTFNGLPGKGFIRALTTAP